MENKNDDIAYEKVLKKTVERNGTSIKRIRSDFHVDFLRAKNFYRRLVEEHIIDDKTGQLIRKR